MGLKNLEDQENVSLFFTKATMIKVIIIGFIYAISLYVFQLLFQFLQVRPIPGDPLLGFFLSFIAGMIMSCKLVELVAIHIDNKSVFGCSKYFQFIPPCFPQLPCRRFQVYQN